MRCVAWQSHGLLLLLLVAACCCSLIGLSLVLQKHEPFMLSAAGLWLPLLQQAAQAKLLVLPG
jgi:hypothetical protein